MDRQIDRQMDGQTEGWTDRQTYRWTNRWTFGWMDRRTQRQTDGHTDNVDSITFDNLNYFYQDIAEQFAAVAQTNCHTKAPTAISRAPHLNCSHFPL